MREIKFRAWDKYGSVMRYTYDGWSSDVDVLAEVWRHIDKYDHIVMQFTGLHDKNGKEIYEGDIVRWMSRNGNEAVHIDEMRWSDDVACFMLMPWIHEPSYTTSMEVIGNIYENPELLEAK